MSKDQKMILHPSIQPGKSQIILYIYCIIIYRNIYIYNIFNSYRFTSTIVYYTYTCTIKYARIFKYI